MTERCYSPKDVFSPDRLEQLERVFTTDQVQALADLFGLRREARAASADGMHCQETR